VRDASHRPAGPSTPADISQPKQWCAECGDDLPKGGGYGRRFPRHLGGSRAFCGAECAAEYGAAMRREYRAEWKARRVAAARPRRVRLKMRDGGEQ